MNDPRAFLAEYQQEFLPDPNERVLAELAMEYHVQAELFDQTICSRRTPAGIAMPGSSQESIAINRHARNLSDTLYVTARRMGFTREEWRRAVHDAANRFQQNWQKRRTDAKDRLHQQDI